MVREVRENEHTSLSLVKSATLIVGFWWTAIVVALVAIVNSGYTAYLVNGDCSDAEKNYYAHYDYVYHGHTYSFNDVLITVVVLWLWLLTGIFAAVALRQMRFGSVRPQLVAAILVSQYVLLIAGLHSLVVFDLCTMPGNDNAVSGWIRFALVAIIGSPSLALVAATPVARAVAWRLLLVSAVICISLAVFLKGVYRQKLDDLAVLRQYGECDLDRSRGSWLATFLPTELVRPVHSFRSRSGDIDEAAIQALARQTQLRSLRIGGKSLTDRSLAKLKHLRLLGELTIWSGPATDDGVAQLLGAKRLTRVWLFLPGVTRATVDRLLVKSDMQRIGLANCSVDGKAIAELHRLKRLDSLNVDALQFDTHLADAMARFPALTHLEVSVREGQRPATMPSLPRLRSFGIEWAKPDLIWLSWLLEADKLERFALHYPEAIDGKLIEFLSSIPKARVQINGKRLGQFHELEVQINENIRNRQKLIELVE